jgi:hypothetical protein
VDFRVSVGASQSTELHLYYGSSVDQALTAQALNPGGLALDHASFTNGNMVWSDLSLLGSNPDVPQSWRWGRVYGLGYTQTFGGTVSIYSNAEAVGLTSTGYDALVMTSSVAAAAGTPLSGLTAFVVGGSNTSAVGQVLYRTANSPAWATAATIYYLNSGGGPYATPAAVAIAIVPYHPTPANYALVQITAPSTYWQLALDAGEVPTVTVGAETTAHLIDGTFTLSTGDSFEFDNVYTDGAITINCVTKQITSTGTLIGSIIPSNPDNWADLPANVAVTWTNAPNTSTSFEWRPKWAV